MFAQVVGAIERRAVRLEEHVLVQVRQPVQLGRLGERSVAHGQLDRDERDRVVLEHDDVEAVGERLVHEGNGFGQRTAGRRRRRGDPARLRVPRGVDRGWTGISRAAAATARTSRRTRNGNRFNRMSSTVPSIVARGATSSTPARRAPAQPGMMAAPGTPAPSRAAPSARPARRCARRRTAGSGPPAQLPVAAAATTMLWASIILPITPPVLLAVHDQDRD